MHNLMNKSQNEIIFRWNTYHYEGMNRCILGRVLIKN